MSTSRRVAVPVGELHVTERGEPGLPTVVLVHGYPDTHKLWDGVGERLAADHHVVAYDVRGAGASSAPDSRRGYRMRHLLEDLVAVADATAPGRRVHLVGHDWGAIQGFAAVLDPAVTGRLASFTAVSAPGLEVARWWLRARLDERTPSSFGQLGRQVLSSAYLGAFRLPVLPERAVRSSIRQVLRRAGHLDPSPTVVEDAVRGLALYRVNGPTGRLRDPVGTLPEGASVRVVTGRDDPFVSPRLFDDLRDRLGVPVAEVDGGHWLPVTHPAVVADHVRAHVAACEVG